MGGSTRFADRTADRTGLRRSHLPQDAYAGQESRGADPSALSIFNFRVEGWLADKSEAYPLPPLQLGLYALWGNRLPRRVTMESTPRLYDTLVDV